MNSELQESLKEVKVLREKYDDLKAEWLTLKQTNNEYKRTLGDKVKEGFRYQKEYELFKQKNELIISELTTDNDKLNLYLSQLTSEKDSLKELVYSLESQLTVH